MQRGGRGSHHGVVTFRQSAHRLCGVVEEGGPCFTRCSVQYLNVIKLYCVVDVLEAKLIDGRFVVRVHHPRIAADITTKMGS